MMQSSIPKTKENHEMRKIYQAFLSITIGLAFLITLWVLSNYFMVGGIQEVVIDGVKHTNILHPHPIYIQVPLAYFLIFGGIGSIIFGVLRLLQIFAIYKKERNEGAKP